MSNFSNLIDISSFFIGILINLLLIAMICYYFKRQIHNLEVSQSEQAKMLYSIVSQQQQQQLQQQSQMMHNMDNTKHIELSENNMNFLGGLDLNNLQENNEAIAPINIDIENDNSSDESEEESDSESETTEVTMENSDTEDVEPLETKSIQYDDSVITRDQYEKMTVKELKVLLETKGKTNLKKNLKKQELVDILVNEDLNFNVEKIVEDEDVELVVEEDELNQNSEDEIVEEVVEVETEMEDNEVNEE